MFGLGVGEILLILGLALIFIGPERLPDLARSLARGYAEFKRSFDEVKNSIEKDLRSTEVEELLRQGKGFPLEEKQETPWAQTPGKLIPPPPTDAAAAEAAYAAAQKEKDAAAPEEKRDEH